MIEVKQLGKEFDGLTVLKGIDALFEPGKTNLIIGQSGSGKTVLMRCMVGLLQPSSGDILYDKHSLTQMNKKDKAVMRQHIGMVFQSAALFDSMRVIDNVTFPLQMFSNMSKTEVRQRGHFCLERVNLSDAADKYPDELSGGMQKRVAIARAIVMQPKYLFCDEPNSGLDPKTSLVIDNLIQDITHEYGITTIINTHDMNSVLGIGEKIIYLDSGHKAWEGTKDDVTTSGNQRLEDFIFASNMLKDAFLTNKT